MESGRILYIDVRDCDNNCTQTFEGAGDDPSECSIEINAGQSGVQYNETIRERKGFRKYERSYKQTLLRQHRN